MPDVFCGATECVNNRRMECRCKAINIDPHNEFCAQYEDYTEGPEYQAPYWARIGVSATAMHREDDYVPPGEYKEQLRGKRAEVGGFVVFYDGDDREGVDGLSVTEEISGMRVPWSALLDAELRAKIRGKVAELVPVCDLVEIKRNAWGAYFFASSDSAPEGPRPMADAIVEQISVRKKERGLK